MERKDCVQTVHPPKRAGFGIKLFSLCENSGYLWNSYVYLGKEPDMHDRQLVNRLGSSGAVIPRLMENPLDKGYRVYVDNWYTAACGTARKNGESFQLHLQPLTSQKVSTGSEGMRTCWLFISTTKRKSVSFQRYTGQMSSIPESVTDMAMPSESSSL